MNKKIINALVFQVGWFICIMTTVSLAVSFTLAALLLHLYYTTEPTGRRFEACFLVLILVIGIIYETVYLWSHVLVVTSGAVFPPIWLLMLWLLFATTINHSLSWLTATPWLAGLLTTIAAPWSYYAGVHLNSSIDFGLSSLFSLLVIGLSWSVLMMAIYHYLARRSLKGA